MVICYCQQKRAQKNSFLSQTTRHAFYFYHNFYLLCFFILVLLLLKLIFIVAILPFLLLVLSLIVVFFYFLFFYFFLINWDWTYLVAMIHLCKLQLIIIFVVQIDCDKTIMVTLKHDDKLKDGSECAFQVLTNFTLSVREFLICILLYYMWTFLYSINWKI